MAAIGLPLLSPRWIRWGTLHPCDHVIETCRSERSLRGPQRTMAPRARPSLTSPSGLSSQFEFLAVLADVTVQARRENPRQTGRIASVAPPWLNHVGIGHQEQRRYLSQQLLGDNHLLDLVGALVDLGARVWGSSWLPQAADLALSRARTSRIHPVTPIGRDLVGMKCRHPVRGTVRYFASPTRHMWARGQVCRC
jgi:hypothetical protein